MFEFMLHSGIGVDNVRFNNSISATPVLARVTVQL